MRPLFLHTRLWLLIVCLIGNSIAPMSALAGSRIWSQGMDICYSTPAETPSQGSLTAHPLCCCYVGNSAAALTSLPFTHASSTQSVRAIRTITPLHFPPLAFGNVRVRGPPVSPFSV